MVEARDLVIGEQKLLDGVVGVLSPVCTLFHVLHHSDSVLKAFFILSKHSLVQAIYFSGNLETIFVAVSVMLKIVHCDGSWNRVLVMGLLCRMQIMCPAHHGWLSIISLHLGDLGLERMLILIFVSHRFKLFCGNQTICISLPWIIHFSKALGRALNRLSSLRCEVTPIV